MEGNTFFFNWEIELINWLQNFASPVTNAIATFFTLFGEELVVVGILGFFYWCCNKEWGKYIGTNVVVGFIVPPFLKNIALRRRPYMDSTSISCLRPVIKDGDIYDIAVQGYSFPSIHASNSLNYLTSLSLCVKKKTVTVISCIIIFFIGASRVYLGVHYPTDILSGWAISAVMVLLLNWLQKKIKNHLYFALIFGLLALPGWFFCKTDDFYAGYGLLIGILIGFYFETRFVNFKNTNNPFRAF